jgi:hypothetical protein
VTLVHLTSSRFSNEGKQMSHTCNPREVPPGYFTMPADGFSAADDSDFANVYLKSGGVAIVMIGNEITRYVNGVETPDLSPKG